MKAVILAAGEGSRMWPLAEGKPKHLLPVAGKPILGHILDALAENNVTDVSVVVGYHEEAIRQTLAEGDYPVHLSYVRQPKWTGTASAVRVAYEVVGKERFIAVYGDLLISSNAVGAVLQKAEDSPRVIGVVRILDASRYGVIELNGDRIVRIVEKPAAMKGCSGWVNTGLYVLDEEVFAAIDRTGKSKSRAEYELTSSLQMLVKRGTEIKSAVIPESDWLDVGRPWDLLVANERVLASMHPKVAGVIENGVTLKGSVSVEEGAVIKSGTCIEGPTYCGSGTKVGPNSRIRPFTSLEKDVVIGSSCDIKNSIVMRGTKIPHLSYVGDSIIGEECNLGAGTITANVRFDKRTIRMTVKEQVTDTSRTKLGVITGDRVQMGINVSILPGVRVGSGSWIGPGVIVREDVPSGKLLVVAQEHRLRNRRSPS